jgi:hypothetical protein
VESWQGTDNNSSTSTENTVTMTSIKNVTVTYVQNNPIPQIIDLSPSSIVEGSPGFTLTVYGSNFVNGAKVWWNGSDRPTIFVNSTEVQATIDSSDVANAGTANVVVNNPDPGGSLSNLEFFQIIASNPNPFISYLEPEFRDTGTGAFTLYVHGSEFVNKSQVKWNELDRPTYFENSGLLSATIYSADYDYVGTASVTVFNPAPGGGLSNSETFTVTAPFPQINDLSPSFVPEGNSAFTLTVIGSGFIQGSQVEVE